MVVFAFNGSHSTSTMHRSRRRRLHGQELSDPSFLTALGNSLKAAALVGVIGGVVGSLAAIGLARCPRKITARNLDLSRRADVPSGSAFWAWRCSGS